MLPLLLRELSTSFDETELPRIFESERATARQKLLHKSTSDSNGAGAVYMPFKE